MQRYHGGQRKPPRENLIIDEEKPDGMYRMIESERKELKRKRKANVRGIKICSLLAKI